MKKRFLVFPILLLILTATLIVFFVSQKPAELSLAEHYEIDTQKEAALTEFLTVYREQHFVDGWETVVRRSETGEIYEVQILYIDDEEWNGLPEKEQRQFLATVQDLLYHPTRESVIELRQYLNRDVITPAPDPYKN